MGSPVARVEISPLAGQRSSKKEPPREWSCCGPLGMDSRTSLCIQGRNPGQTHSYGLNRPPRIAIKADRRIVLVDPAEISAVEAQGNYVILRQKNTSFMVRESLSSVAEELEPYGFLRIHRSSVVNGASVIEIRALTTGEYVLRLKEGRQYLVSRSYKKNLRLLADLWFGLSTMQ